MGVTSSNFTDSFLQSKVSLFNCNKIPLIILLTFHKFLTVKFHPQKLFISNSKALAIKEIY